jgi:hypothetical protein
LDSQFVSGVAQVFEIDESEIVSTVAVDDELRGVLNGQALGRCKALAYGAFMIQKSKGVA